MTSQELLAMKKKFEHDGRQAMGVHLPAKDAKELRWELHQMYGQDPGPVIATLFGMEVLSYDADEVSFET